MNHLSWSKQEKAHARTLFELALSREVAAIRAEAFRILQAADERAVWRVHDYLSRKRREVDGKYDYRYSQLIWVFATLLHQGWVSQEELERLGEEKVAAIGLAATAFAGR